MTLLLTILSVLAAWTFLAVLVMGLLLILKPLQSVRAHLEKIAMGVRAIEQETAPLRTHLDTVTASMGDAVGAAGTAALRLRGIDRSLDDALPALQSGT